MGCHSRRKEDTRLRQKSNENQVHRRYNPELPYKGNETVFLNSRHSRVRGVLSRVCLALWFEERANERTDADDNYSVSILRRSKLGDCVTNTDT